MGYGEDLNTFVPRPHGILQVPAYQTLLSFVLRTAVLRSLPPPFLHITPYTSLRTLSNLSLGIGIPVMAAISTIPGPSVR